MGIHKFLVSTCLFTQIPEFALVSARAHLLKSLFTWILEFALVSAHAHFLFCGVSVEMVSTVVSGVHKLETSKSSIVRFAFDSQSSGKLEYNDIEFSHIIGLSMGST